MFDVKKASMALEILAIQAVLAHDARDEEQLGVAMLNLRSQLDIQACARAQHATAIKVAKDAASDDLQIDEFPLVAEGDNGVWVSSWIWISDEECED